MTSNHRRAAPDEDLAELVRRDAFGDVTGEEAAHLRSDEMCERWLVEITRVTQGIAMQLDNLTRGVGPDRDANWSHRAKHLWRKYNRRSEEAKATVADFRARQRAGDQPALQAEIDRLRGAIRAHERSTLDAGAEPEEWDELLWSYLTRPAKKKAAA